MPGGMETGADPFSMEVENVIFTGGDLARAMAAAAACPFSLFPLPFSLFPFPSSLFPIA